MNSEHVMIWVMREVHANIDFSWCCRFTDKPIFPSCCVRQNFQARSFWVARGWDGRSSSTCFTAWTSEATTTPLPSTHIIMNRVKMSTCRYPTSFYRVTTKVWDKQIRSLLTCSWSHKKVLAICVICRFWGFQNTKKLLCTIKITASAASKSCKSKTRLHATSIWQQFCYDIATSTIPWAQNCVGTCL